MSAPREEGFLSRWSRRKVQEQSEEQRERTEEARVENSPLGEEQQAEVPAAEAPAPEPLPDPETLGRGDDWTPFLKPQVPKELRVQALRRLWRLDPVFANLDGLVDYAEDYNSPEFTGRPVKTLFQVGRGMVVEDEPERRAESKTPAEAAAQQEEVLAEPSASPAPQEEEGAKRQEAAAELPQVEEASLAEEVVLEPREEQEPRPIDRHRPPRKRSALARRWGADFLQSPKEE